MLYNQGGSLAAVDQYMQEVRWIAPLADEEEASLLSCIERGVNVQQARARLAQGYQPLMIGLAKRFVRHCRDMELLDLVQEGNEAFLLGLEQYDAKKQAASFGTFIFSWVRIAMLTSLWRYQGSIRLPLHKVRAMKRLKEVNDELTILLCREPMIAETAAEMGMSEWGVRELLALQAQQVVSFDMVIDEDEEMTLGETIKDPVACVWMNERFASLDDVLKYLTKQERAVVLARYGAADGKLRTQQAVAQQLDMPLHNVQELDRRARRRLRRVLERPESDEQLIAS